jgi:hypothetical protein
VIVLDKKTHLPIGLDDHNGRLKDILRNIDKSRFDVICHDKGYDVWKLKRLEMIKLKTRFT